MKPIALVSAVVGPVLLNACATPQSVAHDDADRLFLKYVALAQRSSPATIEDQLDIAPQAKKLSEESDPCLSAKSRPLLNMYLVATLTIDKNDANWPQASAEARQLLKNVQKTPMPSGCAGHEFPQVGID
ncbi:MAG TPA: hypothetical protein VN229_04265 [Terriglobales bacterium]|nr:hypothetical protein [Terriglobales bacterium]